MDRPAPRPSGRPILPDLSHEGELLGSINLEANGLIGKACPTKIKGQARSLSNQTRVLVLCCVEVVWVEPLGLGSRVLGLLRFGLFANLPSGLLCGCRWRHLLTSRLWLPPEHLCRRCVAANNLFLAGDEILLICSPLPRSF